MDHDVFISHSAKDKAIADAACATLEGHGIRCWIAPRDIVPGSEWGAAIVAAIKLAKVMVLVFSADSNDSAEVHREVKAAFSKGIAVLPVRIDNATLNEQLEYYMGSLHWLDAITPPIEQHLASLAESVQRLLGIPGTQPHEWSNGSKHSRALDSDRYSPHGAYGSSASVSGPSANSTSASARCVSDTPCKEANHALAFAIVASILFAIAMLFLSPSIGLLGVLVTPGAIAKAVKAKRRIRANPGLTGGRKATAAFAIAIAILTLSGVCMIALLAVDMNAQPFVYTLF